MNKYFKKRDKILKNAKGKTALVIRYGAFGDLIMITPVLKQLKKDGYYVVMNAQGKAKKVLTGNPNIDAYIEQIEDDIPIEKLPDYWTSISKGFDKVVNLTNTIEGELLKPEGKIEFNLPHKERHEKCNVNYIDNTMKRAGYDTKGASTELYFSKSEHAWAKSVLKRIKNRFLVVWSLSGSSPHKSWPYTEYVATQFLDEHPDAHIITVGDFMCRILEWEHPRTFAWSDRISIRKAMILTEYADLVVGTETGLLNAASCFDTPKIIMLSHSSEENLSKYWKNCVSVHSDVHCYPCHQLHYSKKSCPLNSATESPLCMTMIRPMSVLIPMMEIYQKAKRKVA